jgi:hypothetical protein
MVERPYYCEDILEAIERQILISGLSKKELAAHLFPGRSIETAKSLLSRALHSENTDVHLWVDHLIAIMDICGSDEIIGYLCDRNGFQRPARRDPAAAILDGRHDISDVLIQFDLIRDRIRAMGKRRKP